MKKLNKNFTLTKMTVESMADCFCSGKCETCGITGCTDFSNYYGATAPTRDAIGIAHARSVQTGTGV